MNEGSLDGRKEWNKEGRMDGRMDGFLQKLYLKVLEPNKKGCQTSGTTKARGSCLCKKRCFSGERI